MNNKQTTNPEISLPAMSADDAKVEAKELGKALWLTAKFSLDFAFSALKNPFGAMLKKNNLSMKEIAIHFVELSLIACVVTAVLCLSLPMGVIGFQMSLATLVGVAIQVAVVHFVLEHLQKKVELNELAEVFLLAWIPARAVSVGISVVQHYSGFYMMSVFTMLSIASTVLYAFLLYIAFKNRLGIEKNMSLKIVGGMFLIGFFMSGGMSAFYLMRAFM